VSAKACDGGRRETGGRSSSDARVGERMGESVRDREVEDRRAA